MNLKIYNHAQNTYSSNTSVKGNNISMQIHTRQSATTSDWPPARPPAASEKAPEFRNSTMIRRPLTEIVLKLDDLQEYEALRRDQGSNSSSTDMQEDTTKPLTTGTKTQEEIHSRIGYAPKKKSRGPSTV
ncbi:hypothetical protein MSG28_013192 [Choristoneura fumiferana]|uniref:Uncharacterized protein n=1 Tax=Choristoneura fumiferana TaxID=7141 RepID=A0ACC0KS83_CHOFU|nr:hypothetical protein MSG28_013192 [Choristoneura fumiferana]